MKENLEEKNEKCEHEWEAVDENGISVPIAMQKMWKEGGDSSFSMITGGIV